MAKTFAARNDDEEINLNEALLTKPTMTEGSKKLAPGESEDILAHWSPRKKAIVLIIVLFANCVTFANMIRPFVELNQVLPLQERPQASQDVLLATTTTTTSAEQEAAFWKKEETKLLFITKVVNDNDHDHDHDNNNDNDNDNATAYSSLRGPLPPFHPHHSASVTYSSRMGPKGNVEYRRDINAPCEFGMLLFSVGPAKDDLPYNYELYNDAYLYSDNNGLCMFYPSYNGFQTSDSPLWNPTDPLQVVFEQLDRSIFHWISSRVYDPHHSKKKWDRSVVGDYAIIAKHSFYDANFYKSLKADINSWK